MSTRQQKSKLLTFGYVNKTYNDSIPIQLVNLIQLFYDDWIYWPLKDKKLNKFINAKYREEFKKSFNIKGIQFEIVSYPNGHIGKDGTIACVYLKIKYLPPNIEHCEYYQEINCEPLNYATVKGLYEATKSGREFGGPICQLSELKHMNSIWFDYLVDIKYIKYKNDCNKIDYCSPINEMQKHSKFTWDINNLLMQKCKKMMFQQWICSNNFDNNSWCILLFPNGRVNDGQSIIALQCLNLLYKVKSMDVKYRFDFEGEIIENTTTLEHNMTACGEYFMSFTQLKQKDSLSISLTLEIMNIYDENNEIIEEKHWEKLGISDC